MRMTVYGNSSSNPENKIDTPLFIEKPYLRTNSNKTNFEKDID